MAKQAHIELVERIRARDPGREIVVGQRIPFVFIQAAKGARQHEQSEDPLYVVQNNLQVDLDLYVQRAVKKPIVRLFCLPGLLGSTKRAEVCTIIYSFSRGHNDDHDRIDGAISPTGSIISR